MPDGHDTISHAIHYGPRFSCYVTAVKLAFGSPHDEKVFDGYIEHFAWCCSNCVSFKNTARSIQGCAVFHSLQATYAVYSKDANYSRKYGIVKSANFITSFNEHSSHKLHNIRTYIHTYIPTYIQCTYML